MIVPNAIASTSIYFASTLGYAQDAAASLMAICQEENSSSVWMELALALFRSNSFTDSKKGLCKEVVEKTIVYDEVLMCGLLGAVGSASVS